MRFNFLFGGRGVCTSLANIERNEMHLIECAHCCSLLSIRLCVSFTCLSPNQTLIGFYSFIHVVYPLSSSFSSNPSRYESVSVDIFDADTHTHLFQCITVSNKNIRRNPRKSYNSNTFYILLLSFPSFAHNQKCQEWKRKRKTKSEWMESKI